MDRRDFLKLITAGTGGVLLGSVACTPAPTAAPTASPASLFFTPVRGPLPLATDGWPASRQATAYAQFEVVDDLVLPEGITYEVIAVWGDRVGDSRFGYNNDYLSLVETGAAQGYLTVNFEYISPVPWSQACQQVTGKNIPLADLQKEVDRPVNAFRLPEGDLKEKIRAVCKEALIDQGLGVLALQKATDGKWARANAAADRRITGISGLDDKRYLSCTGPARAIFRKTAGRGYLDGLGERIIGTFANCAGGTTPWGTVLSCEENIQYQVPEGVYPDGTAFEPDLVPFNPRELNGQGNVFGLAGNKYGWVVEVDPADPAHFGTKHTWLGRYRHEAAAIRAVSGKPLAAYSGCDRTGGHLYKFVSRDPVTTPTDKANSHLFENGTLYVAKFTPDKRGQWIALTPDTPVNPDLPVDGEGKPVIAGGMITLPLRPTGGSFPAQTVDDVENFKKRFRTLGDLYEGSGEEKQGAILIDAHQAANAAGATCTARPEDTDLAPDGSLYISFTSGSPTALDGGADLRIFKGPTEAVPHEYGFVMRLREEGDDPASLGFRWEMLAMGGEPADGGMGFANPDNLLIDGGGNVWMVTDISTDRQNRAVPARSEGSRPLSQSQLSGLYGNNSMWFIPTTGPEAGRAFLFALGPMECEFTGPYFSRDEQTLFLSVQHPGEINGKRKGGAVEPREFMMKTADGAEFKQVRRVPVGSNWPKKGADDPPLSAVVAIYSPGKHFRPPQA